MTHTRKPNIKAFDGNTATANVAYCMTDSAFLYPITPASPMSGFFDAWSGQGRTNIFGNTVSTYQLQSEGGCAGALHGAAAAGSLVTTNTCSQGYLLMIPEMYLLVGQLMPAVFHVASRAVAGQAMNIFCDHSDVMASRQTGICMLSSNTVQECNDLALVSHLASIEASLPFCHFFDGMRTSHFINKIDTFTTEEVNSLYNFEALRKFRTKRAMSADQPTVRGGVENADIFWQFVQAAEPYFKAVPELVEAAMDKIYSLCGRRYHLFDYVGAPDATDVVVLMGSGAATVEEVVNKYAAEGEKIGVVKVRLFRPFSIEHLLKVLPESVKRVAVLDKVKEGGSSGEPLYLDVASALGANRPGVKCYGGIYGLGGKEFNPTHALSVFRFLSSNDVFHGFTVNIDDDVLHSNIPVVAPIVTLPPSTRQSVIFGLGSDGTVGANKEAVSMIADETDLYAQAYFQYDAAKSGGFTVSNLRFGPENVSAPYNCENVDYVACHNPSYLTKFDMVKKLKEGGVFVLNSPLTNEQMDKHLPASVKKSLAVKKAQFYNIDAAGIAASVGLKGRINMIMQTVFFQLSKVLPIERAIELLKNSVKKTYGKKGDDVVNMNIKAIDSTIEALIPVEYPSSWGDIEVAKVENTEAGYINDIVLPVARQEGDSIPVSKFKDVVGGVVPTNTTRVEKRDTAIAIPTWDASKCIQCNECSTVCAHAAIRPFVISNPEELPENTESIKLKAGPKGEDLQYRIQVSPYDCLSCNVCINVCPKDALTMTDANDEMKSTEAARWEAALRQPRKDKSFGNKANREVQFKEPMIEFSKACTGCAETMYAKMLTQLFGDRLHIANACGCSLVWGGMFPTTPWTVNSRGQGPVYAGTLFEDCAEFGLGMTVALKERRTHLTNTIKSAITTEAVQGELLDLFNKWIEENESGSDCVAISNDISDALRDKVNEQGLQFIIDNQSLLRRPSPWIIGGDGWAYDIGYGGLMHVLSMGINVNVFIYDTEVYSNTGGQVSKSTNRAATAHFASTGKKQRKKDFGTELLLMKNIYVASVAIGHNPTQALKAIKEAEAFDGPSVVIGYSPCIAHGIKGGMGNTLEHSTLAVESGYWPLYRYNPALAEAGKSPLTIDAKKIKRSVRDLAATEVRFTQLQQSHPELAEELMCDLEKDILFRNGLLENFKNFYETLAKN
ncbi:hypothetical protein P9112_011476 [Eukaryota sp. TZLM1-RC]